MAKDKTEQAVVSEEKVEQAAETTVAKTKARKGMLFSRLNYPVTVKYKGEDAVVSPNAKLNIEDVEQLQADLPKGLILRTID